MRLPTSHPHNKEKRIKQQRLVGGVTQQNTFCLSLTVFDPLEPLSASQAGYQKRYIRIIYRYSLQFLIQRIKVNFFIRIIYRYSLQFLMQRIKVNFFIKDAFIIFPTIPHAANKSQFFQKGRFHYKRLEISLISINGLFMLSI